MSPFLPLLATLTSGAVAPTCTDLLEGMRAKVEANYAGYHLEVITGRAAEYAELLRELRLAADQVADREDCLDVLVRYIDWFDDPHLFVFQSWRLDTAETRARMATVPRVQVSEAAVRQSLSARQNNSDPIEGVWHDRGLRLAIIPDPAGTDRRYLAVALASDTVTVEPGMVLAVIDAGPDGYRMQLRWRTLGITHPPVSLHRSGTLLRAAPAMWSKAWPLPAGEHALPDTSDARRPTFAVADGVPVFAIPSHQFQYRAVLDSLLNDNRAVIDAAERMVIDLRGNEGGSSPMSNGLLPYILGEPEHDPTQIEAPPVMLSSPDQIAYARRSFGPETSAFVSRLAAALEAAPGELVPLYDPEAPVPTRPDPAPIHGPDRVAILIDGGTVSASEVLVLKAKRSARALVIGEPTAGALDYQSASIVRVHPEESRWLLGYPTITAHTRLPEYGMRGKGIMPEIAVQWNAVSDPVAEALRLLR